jgi:hypothetical protein
MRTGANNADIHPRVTASDGAAKRWDSSGAGTCFRENKNVRKRIVSSVRTTARPSPGSHWMDLEQIATVEVTSEDPDFPIESALGADGGPGWRASQKGKQFTKMIGGHLPNRSHAGYQSP